MEQLFTFGRWFISALAALGVLSYGAAALVTVADVIGRRFGLPIEGVVDLVQLFFIAGAWLVMPYAFMTASHVGVDFLLHLLPRALAAPLKVAIAALSLGLVALMLWQGYTTFLTRTMFGDRSQQLGIPIDWYWYPLLLGLAISLLAIVLQFVSPSKGHPEDD
ncbi:TRAP transporter small permease [Paracoccus sp. T5]|uniref:TRAP transporter small permease n=1 Tax=Paracoccus sp. T5 TaxID=3402161 RepID=UPI003AF44CA5